MDFGASRADRTREGHYKDAQWNTSAPILQESADNMINGIGFQQLSAMTENNTAQGQPSTSLQNAQNLTAYQITPEEMRQSQRRKMAGHDGKKRLPTWVWGVIGVGVLLVLTRK
jgi:parvulin-like peptidyl-prolyl isomerase